MPLELWHRGDVKSGSSRGRVAIGWGPSSQLRARERPPGEGLEASCLGGGEGSGIRLFRPWKGSNRESPDPRLGCLFIEPRGPLRAQGHRDASLGVCRRTGADAGRIDCTAAPPSPHLQRTLWPRDPPRSGSLALPPPGGIHRTSALRAALRRGHVAQRISRETGDEKMASLRGRSHVEQVARAFL